MHWSNEMPGTFNGTEEEKAALDAFVKLTRAAESVIARVHRHLAQKGITTSQFGVLEMIYHLGPLSQGKIGRKLLRSGGNMTMVIDNLEKRGLVLRRRDESDRRYYIVELTQRGGELVAELFPAYAVKVVEQMGVLTMAEMQELGMLCKKLGKQTDLYAGEPDEAA
jgi:MarR family 2-MHQ and catechol resistance regulon transcriptional repressor